MIPHCLRTDISPAPFRTAKPKENPIVTSRITENYPRQRNALTFSGAFAALLCAACLLPASAIGRDKTSPPAQTAVSEKKSDLKELRGKIETLKKEKAKTEGQRATVEKQIQGTQKKISATQLELQTLAKRHASLQATLKNLGSQTTQLERRIREQQAQLERLVYQQYVRGNPDALRLLLNGEDPNQLARDLDYLASIGKARSQLVEEIQDALRRKQALAAETSERASDLADVEARQKQQHDKLIAQQEERKKNLEKISATLSEQKHKLAELQRDEKNLSRLIDNLAAKAARDAQARKTGRAKIRKQTGGKSATAEISNENTPETMPAGSFQKLKGRLHLPVRGSIVNRFGGERLEGSTWKGLFIRAGSGNNVKAIAAGQVVFADWMRGFGNLVIVDHGDNYLTIYGNNDSLLKRVGDTVQGGDNIARVGNSGGNPESGLYFELRYRGQPVDPLKWVDLK